MSDRVSHDERTAAYLSRQDSPADHDGPSRAEVAEEEAEQRAFEEQLRRAARDGRA